MGQNQTNLRAKINVFLTGSQFNYIIVIIISSSLNQYISQLICKLPFTFSHLANYMKAPKIHLKKKVSE